MKLKFRYLLVTACCAVTMFSVTLISHAQSSRSERDLSTDDDPLLHPLPPGIRVRAFIHTPRVVEPNHLGTCTNSTTAGENVDWYDCAPWQLQSTITWKLNESTVPTNLSKVAARERITAAFSTWNDAYSNCLTGSANCPPAFSLFSDGGATTVKNTRLDGTNAILWKKLRGGVVGETYVWYDTATRAVIEVDTVFNSGLPWGILPEDSEACLDQQPLYDVFELQNIATHEFGHWIGLDDVFGAVDLTMYLFGAGGERKKRSLGTGDIDGVGCLYHGICPP